MIFRFLSLMVIMAFLVAGCPEVSHALLFPGDFVGRGDMSRGGLLLRSAREGRELSYRSVFGAVRHGPRPPKLPPLPRARRESPA